MTSRRAWIAGVALIAMAAWTVPASAAKAKAKPKAKAQPDVTAPSDAVEAPNSARDPGDPQKFIAGLYQRLDQLSRATATLAELHKQIAKELEGIIDYTEMGRLSLGPRWNEITEPQRKEFVGLLSGMVVNTYVRRFKPGTPVSIRWNEAPKPLGAGKVQVPSTIQVKKTSADVQYDLLARSGRWLVYDIVVDDASQVQTYRQSFRKILDKEGWAGLMTRMRKAAEKKAG